MKKIWHDQAWEDYLNLQNDKKLPKKAKKIQFCYYTKLDLWLLIK